VAIGGDADGLWLPDRVAGTPASVVTVPGAGHSLTVAENWRKSIALPSDALETIATDLDAQEQ
jgi:hypothetical protein